MGSVFVVGMIVRVSKIDRLKVLVVLFFPLNLSVFDEELNLP